MVHERRPTTWQPPYRIQPVLHPSLLPPSLSPKGDATKEERQLASGPIKGNSAAAEWRESRKGGKEGRREGGREKGEEGKSEESNNSDNLVGFISHATDRPTDQPRATARPQPTPGSPAKKTTLGDKDAEGGRGRTTGTPGHHNCKRSGIMVVLKDEDHY